MNYPTVNVEGENVRIHRLRAERALGKPLPKKAVVHHADGSKNAGSVLVICQDSAYHSLLHMRMRVRAAGGNPNTDAVCSRCSAAKPVAQFAPTPARSTGRNHMCHGCDAEKQSKRRSEQREHINSIRRANYALRRSA